MKPGTVGQTIGRSSSETKHSAGCGCVAVNGRRMQFARRIQRQRQHFAENRFRHAELVVGNRQAAFGDVKNALRGAAVAAGLCSTPCLTR